MGGIFGITGTPGTGKKTVASAVAKELGAGCTGLNEIALKHGLRGSPAGEIPVDPRDMRRWVARDVRAPAVVHGHLLPYVVPPRAVRRVVVLRCEPGVLKARLRARGYPRTKVAENVEAELIGVVSADAYDAFGAGKTSEVDTTSSTPEEAAASVASALRGSVLPSKRFDWTLGYDSAKLVSLLSAGP